MARPFYLVAALSLQFSQRHPVSFDTVDSVRSKPFDLVIAFFSFFVIVPTDQLLFPVFPVCFSWPRKIKSYLGGSTHGSVSDRLHQRPSSDLGCPWPGNNNLSKGVDWHPTEPRAFFCRNDVYVIDVPFVVLKSESISLRDVFYHMFFSRE